MAGTCQEQEWMEILNCWANGRQCFNTIAIHWFLPVGVNPEKECHQWLNSRNCAASLQETSSGCSPLVAMLSLSSVPVHKTWRFQHDEVCNFEYRCNLRIGLVHNVTISVRNRGGISKFANILSRKSTCPLPSIHGLQTEQHVGPGYNLEEKNSERGVYYWIA